MTPFLTPRLLKQASNNIFVINTQVNVNTLQEVLAVTSRQGYLCPELQENWQLLTKGTNGEEESSSSPEHLLPRTSREAPSLPASRSAGSAAGPPAAGTGRGFPTQQHPAPGWSPREGGREGEPGLGGLALPAPDPGGKGLRRTKPTRGRCAEFAGSLTSS